MDCGEAAGSGSHVYAVATPGGRLDWTLCRMNCHPKRAGIDRGVMAAGGARIPARPIVAIRSKPVIGPCINEFGNRIGLPASFAGVSKELNR